MMVVKVIWRLIRALAIGTFILLASIVSAILIMNYMFSRNKGNKVAINKDLHMIKTTNKIIRKALTKIHN